MGEVVRLASWRCSWRYSCVYSCNVIAQDVFDASGAATDDGLQRLAAGRKAVFVVVIKHGQQPVAFALTEACTGSLCPLRGIDAAGTDLAAQHPGGNPRYIADAHQIGPAQFIAGADMVIAGERNRGCLAHIVHVDQTETLVEIVGHLDTSGP